MQVRRYTSPLHAEQAAQWLRDHGVPAKVVSSTSGLPSGFFEHRPYVLMIQVREQMDEAERLLHELDETPATLDAGWEADALPDLSRLEGTGVDAPCPHCDVALPLDAALASCPSCGAPVDVAEIIADRHGPEALEKCYDAVDVTHAEATVDPVAFAAPCPSCGALLAGQPVRGRCESCGGLYDKDEIIRRLSR